MKTVFLGIGSNIGNSLEHCFDVVESLHNEIRCRVDAVSGWYSSEPWGDSRQDWFTNGVARITTEAEPAELLEICQNLEILTGRVKSRRWGPRVMDLDILLWPGRLVVSRTLMIPHPRLHQRRFVLQPLCDLAPDVQHPVLGKTMHDLLRNLDDPLQVHPLESNWRFGS